MKPFSLAHSFLFLSTSSLCLMIQSIHSLLERLIFIHFPLHHQHKWNVCEWRGKIKKWKLCERKRKRGRKIHSKSLMMKSYRRWSLCSLRCLRGYSDKGERVSDPIGYLNKSALLHQPHIDEVCSRERVEQIFHAALTRSPDQVNVEMKVLQ